VHSTAAHVTAWILIGIFLVVNILALGRFVASKNTVVPIRPATSLQTSGIYALTRNPMYLALAGLYCGLGIFLGNTWTFILLPPLILTMQAYVDSPGRVVSRECIRQAVCRI
jgi:protein-S-isoprenylcysteine O-methyltransferase Ste14